MVGWGIEECEMCDYSLHSVKTRPAKVGDKLIVRDFGTGTRGFSASEDKTLQFACYQALSCPSLRKLDE
jgi:hypothetical protein